MHLPIKLRKTGQGTVACCVVHVAEFMAALEYLSVG